MKTWTWIAACTGLVCATQLQAQKSTSTGGIDPLERGQIVNIVDWDGGQLPQRYQRSQQLPLSLEDIKKLSANKFSDATIIKMLEQRRCACDASVDALVELKESNVSEGVLQALSLHSLAPNRALELAINIDFEGLGGAESISNKARKGYLYLIVPDGERERVFIGNLQAILAGQWQRDALADNTDQLLPKKVRRVTFSAEVPLKTYGAKKALVFTSTRPDIYTSADIPERDREDIREYSFDYPSSSLQHFCNLQVLYRQDQMLKDKWHLARSNFQCEWD
ncbi:MAG: hypothetical protein ACI906_004002 [Candidatus Latescibacterota bacterium]|jgi:hypothetical protein